MWKGTHTCLYKVSQRTLSEQQLPHEVDGVFCRAQTQGFVETQIWWVPRMHRDPHKYQVLDSEADICSDPEPEVPVPEPEVPDPEVVINDPEPLVGSIQVLWFFTPLISHSPLFSSVSPSHSSVSQLSPTHWSLFLNHFLRLISLLCFSTFSDSLLCFSTFSVSLLCFSTFSDSHLCFSPFLSCRMLTPISRLECLTPGFLLSTQKESSSRRRRKATSPRKCATQCGYGGIISEMNGMTSNYHFLIPD